MTRYELVNETGQLEPRQPGIEVNNSAIPEWTSTLVTDWSLGPWSVAWSMRFSDGVDESCGGANGFAICDDSGNVRRFVNIFANDEDIRFLKNLETPVKDSDEISIVPAIAGGR